VQLSIFISVTNQLDAQNFCFTISLFHASTCFEHMCSSSGGQNCITQPLISSHLQVLLKVGRGVYGILVGKPEDRRPLGRPRRRWVDNIRKDLQEVGCGYIDWIGLAQDRDRWRTLVSAVMNLRVP